MVNLFKMFRKRKSESSMNTEFLILKDEDIKKLLNGKTISFEVEKFVPEIMVCTEECYNQLMKEVKEFKYD